MCAATSMMASMGRSVVEYEWDWQGVAWAAYLIVLHIALAFVLWQRWGPRYTCRRRRADNTAGTQANLLPNASLLTVEGLRNEAKFMGLRTNGLRNDLEVRVSNELLNRSGDAQ